MTHLRSRLNFLLLACATIVIGLAVHLGGRALPPAVNDVLGDALWAVMMLWWMGVIAPRAPLWVRAVAALAVCFAVELSQAIRTPALDAIRATLLGHLVLGSGFDPRDFLAYAGGVLVAATAAWAATRRPAPSQR